MDLKALLLYSTSSKKIIQRRKRLLLGKLCFCINYQVAGKYLTVTRIRKCRKNDQRMRQPFFLKTRLLFMKKWKTISVKPIMIETQMQTAAIAATTTTSRGTECDIKIQKKSILQESRTQQTVCKHFHSQSTQTDLDVTAQAIQTEQYTLSQSHQTEWNLASTAAQTSVNTCSAQTQTEVKWFCSITVQTEDGSLEMQSSERLQVEKEAVILLLNEIGEMIINQNHLMHNNSTLLQQISDMTLLNKLVSKHNTIMKSRDRFERLSKMRMFLHKRRKTRYIFCKAEPKEMRDIPIQTIFLQETVDASTQTIIKESPGIKLLWMKKKEKPKWLAAVN